MKTMTKVGFGVVACCIVCLWSGCQFGALSKVQSFSDQYTITLQNEHPDVLTAVADVGKGMGFTTMVNKVAGSVTLMQVGPSLGELFGVIKNCGLTITATDGGKKLTVIATASGNLGAGVEKDVIKLVDDFKAKLLARLGEK